jgi:hypothetical protein
MDLSFTPYARMTLRANFQETWGKLKGTVGYFFPKLVGNKRSSVSVPRQILLVYCIVLKLIFPPVLFCHSGEKLYLVDVYSNPYFGNVNCTRKS